MVSPQKVNYRLRTAISHIFPSLFSSSPLFALVLHAHIKSTSASFFFSTCPPPQAHTFLYICQGLKRVCKHSLLQWTDNRGNSRCERKLIRSLTQLGRVQGYSSQRQLTVLTGLSKHSNHCTCLFSVFLSHLGSIHQGMLYSEFI